MSSDRQIVPGICISPTGQATIDPSLKNVLFDLALNLEGPTKLPVDIEHVVAAIVLAVRTNQIDATTPITPDDPKLLEIIAEHVKFVFANYGGKVGRDE